jgi:Na+/H+-dicarboxylate symporter
VQEGEGKISFTARIVIGMVVGVAVGLLLNGLGDSPTRELVVNDLLFAGGQIFLSSLKMLVVPLVFVSLVCGTAAIEDVSRLGRVGGKTFFLYLTTTGIAISLALVFAIVVQPGAGFDLPTDASYTAKQAPSLTRVIIDLVPTNPIQAMADARMLQIIVFAGLLGLAITLSGDAGKRVLGFFTDLNDVVMKLVTLLMTIAPYGVFCLLARVFADQGLRAIGPMAGYFFVVLAALGAHALITYPLLLRVLAGLDPLTFFRKMREPLALAFSTASSGATLPVTLRTVEEKLGAENSVAAFTIPLGATVNMDGTAIMQGVATGFIAQAYGIELGSADYLMVVLTATLASVGTAAVPSAGLVMLAMVLEQVNLPVEGIGLIIGVDRLLDMVRTAVNVAGDASVTCVVARSEGQFSDEIFRS